MSIPSNAPDGYDCPICYGLNEPGGSKTLVKSEDFVYRDNLVTAFINTFFLGKNAGHVIVVPNEHYENIYTVPLHVGQRVFEVAQKVAIAMKEAYSCDGITTRNNNESAGDQHAFHYHFHVFPRYVDDGFNNFAPSDKRLAEPEERATYAEKLKPLLSK